jgi:hypothetical protein
MIGANTSIERTNASLTTRRCALAADAERAQRIVIERTVATETADESDGLAAMRGLMTGLAWVASAWVLIGAILLLD